VRASDRNNLDRWLAIHQPRLRLSTDAAGCVSVSGQFDLVHLEEGGAPVVYETFEIDFTYPNNYPESLPTVFENGGRIKRESDNHINCNGSICYGVPAIIAARRPDLKPSAFISEILHDYFLGYLHFLEFGFWPFGEVGHGYAGAIDYMAELLKCAAKPNKVKALLFLLQLKHRRDRWGCSCGSGKRLGRCCRQALNRAALHITRREAARLRPLIEQYDNEAADTAKHTELVAQLETLRDKMKCDAIARLKAGRQTAKSTKSIREDMVHSASRRVVKRLIDSPGAQFNPIVQPYLSGMRL